MIPSAQRQRLATPFAPIFRLFASLQSRPLLTVAVLTVLLLALALFHNDARSLWFDEAYSLNTVLNWSPWDQLKTRSNMWLYYLTLNSWIGLGTDERVLRALSALYAAAGVPVIYLLGRELFGTRAGLIAALLLAVNAFLVRYGQELRAYSMVIGFSGLSTLFFVRVVLARSRHAWFGYGFVAGLSLYVHYFLALVLAAHIISLALLPLRRVPWRHLFAAGALALLLTLPMWLTFAPGAGDLDWVPKPRPADLWAALKGLTGGGVLLVVYLVFALPWLVGWSFEDRRIDASWSDRYRLWRVGLLSVWWLGPALLVFVVSVMWKPLFVDRYFAISLVPLVLMAAAGVNRLGRPALIGAAVVLLGMLNLRAVVQGYKIGLTDFDYRDAVASVMDRARAGDGIGVYNYATWPAVHYYLQRFGEGRPVPNQINLASGPFDDGGAKRMPEPDAATIERLPESCPRFWLVLSLYDVDQRDRLIELLTQRYRLVDDRHFGVGVRVQLYERPRLYLQN